MKFPIKFKVGEKNKETKEETKKEDTDPEIVDNNKPLGLKGHLKEVKERLDILTQRDKKTEQKEFRLPSRIKRQLKKLALKNKIMVLYLTRNRVMKPIVTEIKDGFINIGGVPHNCSPDFIYLYKGKYPAIVLQEWDINPIGTEDYYDAVEKKRIADPIAIGIRMMEAKENLMKKLPLSPKAWVFIGIAVIAGLYVLLGGI